MNLSNAFLKNAAIIFTEFNHNISLLTRPDLIVTIILSLRDTQGTKSLH